jgi:hypothetical protein
MDATMAGLVGVAVGGVLVGILTLVNTVQNRRSLRELLGNERDERRLADLRVWRDRSTPALVQTRNLLANYHSNFPKAIGLEARHFDSEVRRGYIERIAKEIDEKSRSVSDMLTEIGSGHPSQNVRDLSEEVRALVVRHCSEMSDQLLNGDGMKAGDSGRARPPRAAYDFRPDHDRAQEVVVELTNAIHATVGKPDALSIILDR